jgi:plasmid stabilization system protein ParE
MNWDVVLARKAAREIEEQYDWLAQRSQTAANRWEAIGTFRILIEGIVNVSQ